MGHDMCKRNLLDFPLSRSQSKWTNWLYVLTKITIICLFLLLLLYYNCHKPVLESVQLVNY